MSFKNIRGQDSAVEFLKGSIGNNRIAHAYIFSGPGGVGKSLAARNFAKALNCLNQASYDTSTSSVSTPIPQNLDRSSRGVDACDACASCRKIDNSNHPDIFLLKPEKEGASIKIDAMRELIKSVGLKPYEGRKKIYIIDGAECMTQETQNALLKTLEEPPSESVLILITGKMSMLLETIISRSQVVKFRTLGPDEVGDILKKEYNVEDTKAHILSRFFSGRLGEAIRHKDSDFFEKRKSLVNSLLKREFIDSEAAPKEELKVRLDTMLTWYRDILTLKSGADASMLVNIDMDEAVSGESKKLKTEYLEKIIERIFLTLTYLDRNANTKLAMGVLEAMIGEIKR